MEENKNPFDYTSKELDFDQAKAEQKALQMSLNSEKKKFAAQIKRDKAEILAKKGNFKIRKRLPFARKFEVFRMKLKMWWHRVLVKFFT
jgi:hypothetical protein